MNQGFLLLNNENLIITLAAEGNIERTKSSEIKRFNIIRYSPLISPFFIILAYFLNGKNKAENWKNIYDIHDSAI